MLHFETVTPDTLALLKELMSIEGLKQFNLVGGTALSLQLGHRISVDLDLFSHDSFDKETIMKVLSTHFNKRFELISSLKNKLGVFSFIDNVKIDICRHDGKFIGNVYKIDGIRMWELKEIAAAKVNAISRRATKKDFWDINELLNIFSIDEIASFYQEKYNPMLAIGVARMITYFDDADESETPNCLNNKTWDEVKKEIKKKVNNNLK
jgi:predicted nucleotidyltransferase component of viral defense system